jgi:hypothetical protein
MMGTLIRVKGVNKTYQTIAGETLILLHFAMIVLQRRIVFWSKPNLVEKRL